MHRMYNRQNTHETGEKEILDKYKIRKHIEITPTKTNQKHKKKKTQKKSEITISSENRKTETADK